MYIHSSQTMRAAEQALFDSGAISSDALMDAAITACVTTLRRDAQFHHAPARFSQVIVYAGKGKNAGDAIGIARELGYTRITLRCAAPPAAMAPETRRQIELAAPGCIQITEAPPTLVTGESALLLDGLLGSGARGPLSPAYAALVQEMNTLRQQHPRCLTLAVDIPTGLPIEPPAPTAPAVVQADATLAIGCVKPNMLTDGAENYTGRLICIPLPQVPLPPSAACVADEGLLARLPRRDYSCFKNRAGRVRIVAGSPGYTGAAVMCAEAALAAGAGLVELYCQPNIYPILATRVAAEVMVRPVGSYAEVSSQGADALLIGPGLGQPAPDQAQALRRLAEQATCPIVLDADGLNLAAAGGWQLPPHSILTPHPGEMRRLHPAAGTMSRAEQATTYVHSNPCILVLKGARTITTDGHACIYNSTGGPHMANGGQGDVLAGTIAGFAAQGVPPLQAAALGAYCCGRAADMARAAAGYPLSIRATQLLPYLTAGEFPC